jgi:heme/copper-type cytochrome/quinol oxidase subunit 2
MHEQGTQTCLGKEIYSLPSPFSTNNSIDVLSTLYPIAIVSFFALFNLQVQQKYYIGNNKPQ